jgi:hypothetical protein
MRPLPADDGRVAPDNLVLTKPKLRRKFEIYKQETDQREAGVVFAGPNR